MAAFHYNACVLPTHSQQSPFPESGRSPAELLSNADAAMYEAKTSGPAKYVFYPASAPDPEQRRA